MALTEGTVAPIFRANADSGKIISLKELKNKWIILYFYPKDNTSGCTREACDFRDNMERLSSMDAEIIGISPDSVKSHDGFKSKYNLNFNLISDTDKSICNAYDVIGEKSLYGKKYLGVIRTTYIIDPKGKIKKTYSPVKVEGHVDMIISDLTSLRSE